MNDKIGMDIITCHMNADFDCLSSMVAARKIFPEAKIVFPGSQEKPVREFLKTYPVETEKIKDIDLAKINRLIIVDTRDIDRIGPFKEIVRKKNVQVYIYDHHPLSSGTITGTFETIEDIGATTTILIELIRKKNIFVSPMEATLLCLGVYEETGAFRFLTTTERDLLAVAFLLKRGANLNIVSNFIKLDLSRDDLSLLNEFITSLSEVIIHSVRIKIGIATRDKYVSDVAQIAHRIMDMEDIDALILILNTEGKMILIGRSRVSELNMADLMSYYGGGGHWAAASATLKEIPPDILKENIINHLSKVVRPTKIAKDIMTSPVSTIQWNATIKEAETIMTKYGINVLPVIKKNNYLGLLSREIVEKALFHGFHKSKIIDFTTTDAQVTTPEISIREIEKIMIERNQRFMPVLEREAVVGAITRTDLLRTLYEDFLRKSHLDQEEAEVKAPSRKKISSLIQERFPSFIVNLLQTTGEMADEIDMNAYLVGGSVRDLLRGEQNLDIDIVIEGDGIRFAGELSRRLHGKLRIHDAFQTAKITEIRFPISDSRLPISHFIMDIATARTEYYEKPATLPKVETSSIKKDLYRRDFTINTLAVKLNKKDFGTLIDFFGAQRDIKEKTIRVLHNLSFIEDPTRAFRAVRFSERFGFKISKHTQNLIKSALRFNLFDKLSGARLYDELLLTFHETEPVRALKRLSDYGLLKVIHPELKFSEQFGSLFQKIHDTISWYNLLFLEKRIDTGTLCLMTFVSFLQKDQQELTLKRLSTPSKTRETILKRLESAKDVADSLNPDDPVNIYHTLKGLNVEALLFVMAKSENRKIQKAISRYLIELKDIKPELTGNDLKGMGIAPGPVYSEIFEKIIDNRLSGKIENKEDEISFIKKHYPVFLFT